MRDELFVIAGDDLTFAVDCEAAGSAFFLPDGTTAELILHLPDGSEKRVPPLRTENNRLIFTLKSDMTASLFPSGESGRLFFCVRLSFPDGTSQTPLYRAPLLVGRC